LEGGVVEGELVAVFEGEGDGIFFKIDVVNKIEKTLEGLSVVDAYFHGASPFVRAVCPFVVTIIAYPVGYVKGFCKIS
jgi:hypothetical protein